VIKFFVFLFIFNFVFSIPHYYATTADMRYFNTALNLIRSIKTNDYKDLEQILVFDIGFSPGQVEYLKRQSKVKVIKIRSVHRDLTKFFKTAPGRNVRGWFAWKPVAIKQALEEYPYILYLDSGMRVLKPLDFLFEYIAENNYFLIDAETKIWNRFTSPLKKIIESVSEYEDKDVGMHCGGIQGLSRAMLSDYIDPIYDYVAKDVSLFVDDGSALLGFGSGRHDQTIFSIYGRRLNLKMFNPGWNKLKAKNNEYKFHIHWDKGQLNEQSCIFY
jgi:hypothetical protein